LAAKGGGIHELRHLKRGFTPMTCRHFRGALIKVAASAFRRQDDQ
jgi:hypothetical protein